MAKRKRKKIGLQNRLEIIIQSVLDFGEEGGQVTFDIQADQLTIIVPGVCEQGGRICLVATTVVPPAPTTAPITPVNEPLPPLS